ncbi:hypothetical protein [Legionella israelensis]|uniref:Coiled-coil protein n=1 Tax=Legionella israelensis TaxID=454 RepID=A0A0W0W6F6_9GAMM|nr:hypothetical protein [Legionella israelensis]KTD27912.1 coiled-coil protein [Legionella israelensis]QBS09443.1 hypothetical protein E4T55_05975 [Legionella israelensis]SCX95407.1 hypothetical protein SAMN02746069_00769 [Legionella israelensis DSM 19235]STX60348.1 coiled-coil protein [Legionella israelensis]
MTIFLKVAQEFLNVRLNSTYKTSVAADNCVSNTVLSYLWTGRNTELSEEKRQLLMNLMLEIKTMDGKESDEATLEYLKQLLDDKRAENQRLCKKYGYKNEGETGRSLVAIKNFLDDIHKKLSEHEFIDKPFDSADPFNEFQYHAAFYLIQKIEDVNNQGLIEKLAIHLEISSLYELAEDKENMLLSVLKKCEESLQALGEEKPDYLKWRKNNVIEAIEKVKRENTALCKKYGSKFDIPFALSLFSTLKIGLPTLRPDVGELDKCMQKALEQISPEESIEKSSSLVLH